MFGFAGMVYPNASSADVHKEKTELVKDVGSLDVAFVAELSGYTDACIDVGSENYCIQYEALPFFSSVVNDYSTEWNRKSNENAFNFATKSKHTYLNYRRGRDGLQC